MITILKCFYNPLLYVILEIQQNMASSGHDFYLKRAQMFFGKPWQEWIDQYQQSHENKINRACHFAGIPMIAISIVLLLLSIAISGLFWIAVSLFISGWILQFVGHIAEGKPPEFIQDWRFLFVGLRWWFQKFVSRK